MYRLVVHWREVSIEDLVRAKEIAMKYGNAAMAREAQNRIQFKSKSTMKTGIELIAEERQRQIEVEGFDAKHDDKVNSSSESLAYAAACYAIPSNSRTVYAGSSGHSTILRMLWPWSASWWKPSPKNRIRELQKAGALIAAEIDRLNREV